MSVDKDTFRWNAISYLFPNDLRYTSIAVPQSINGDTRSKIKIFPVLNVPHVATLALLKHRWRSHIGRDHVRELLVN